MTMTMTRAGWLSIGWLFASACGAGATSPPEPSADETDEASAPADATSVEATESDDGAEDERARVIREAEAFVRAQGYTDAPATASGDEIVHEGIEGTMEDRRGMLGPHAVRASGANGDFSVVFAYREARYAGRGRMLRMREGQRPSFVHQDLLLDPPAE